MNIKLKEQVYDMLALTVLFFVLCEFLYADYTGQRAALTSVFLTFTGIGVCVLKRVKIYARDIIGVLLAVTALLYSRSSEGIRYFLLIFSMVLWTKIECNYLSEFLKFIVLVTAVLSFGQFMQGITRVTGFFPGSPTQNACLLLVSELYFLIEISNSRHNVLNYVFVFVCIILLYMTETRTNFFAGLLFFAVYFVIALMNYFKIPFKKFLLYFCVICGCVMLLFVGKYILDFVSSKMNRANAGDSSATRMGIYKVLFSEIFKNPWVTLFGQRGGFVEIRLKEYFQVQSYFPGHQDYLVMICEYGLLGCVSVFVGLLYRHKAWLFFLMAFSVCSFHNIILMPSIVLLMVILMVDLEKKNYRVLPK